MKQPCVLSGILHGGGVNTDCKVSAIKALVLETGVFYYIDYAVTQVSNDLPDGLYTLAVNGAKLRTLLRNGTWITTGPA